MCCPWKIVGPLLTSFCVPKFQGMRTGNPVGLDLVRMFWRRMLGEPATWEDVADVDARFARALAGLRAVDNPAAFAAFCVSPAAAHLCGGGSGETGGPTACGLRWSVRLACGRVAELTRGGRGRPVGWIDRHRYADAALRARTREFDPAVTWIRQGLAANVPIFILPLLTYEEVSLRVCGEATVDLNVLRGIMKNKLQGGDSDPAFGWLWEALESFSHPVISLICRSSPSRFLVIV